MIYKYNFELGLKICLLDGLSMQRTLPNSIGIEPEYQVFVIQFVVFSFISNKGHFSDNVLSDWEIAVHVFMLNTMSLYFVLSVCVS